MRILPRHQVIKTKPYWPNAIYVVEHEDGSHSEVEAWDHTHSGTSVIFYGSEFKENPIVQWDDCAQVWIREPANPNNTIRSSKLPLIWASAIIFFVYLIHLIITHKH